MGRWRGEEGEREMEMEVRGGRGAGKERRSERGALSAAVRRRGVM